jgi:DNA-binding winged helix-turn-helix (wHTH) protein
LQLRTGELRKSGVKIKLQAQPFQTLLILLERPGELITRQEFEDRIWGAGACTNFDHSLNKAIKSIRAALGDSTGNSRFVETLPRRGYRFIAPVVMPPFESEPNDVAPVRSTEADRLSRTTRNMSCDGLRWLD